MKTSVFLLVLFGASMVLSKPVKDQQDSEQAKKINEEIEAYRTKEDKLREEIAQIPSSASDVKGTPNMDAANAIVALLDKSDKIKSEAEEEIQKDLKNLHSKKQG